MTAIATATEYVNLADACRVSGRHDSSIKAWILMSAPLDADNCPLTPWQTGARRDRFYAGEVRRLSERRGTGQAFAIRLDALQRVHFARGKTYWNLDAIQANMQVPPHVADEMNRLREQVRELQLEIKSLRSQLTFYRDRAPSGAARVATLDSALSAMPPAVPPDPADLMRPKRGSTPRPDDAARPSRSLPMLPADLVSVTSVATRHGIGRAHSDVWRRSRRLASYVKRGPWTDGDSRIIENAIDAQGQRALGMFLGTSKHFTACTRPETCMACAGAVEAGWLDARTYQKSTSAPSLESGALEG